MLARLFLLFTIVPVIELWLLIELGKRMGAPATVGLVLVTGFVGAALAKREGLKVLREWQGTMSKGQVPAEGLTGAALILVGGVLLITPGVLSDITGILLLIPATRRFIAARIRTRLERRMARSGAIHFTNIGLGGFGPEPRVEREVQGEAKVEKPKQP